MQFGRISVVIPVYNSEAILESLTSRLKNVLEACTDGFEVILINDDSQDNSWKVIEKLASCYGFVKGVNLMRNYGQHNSLLAGIRSAQYETIVTMDDDLQHPPEEIVKLLEKLNYGYDVVYGTPQREQHTLLRNIASRIVKIALKSAMKVEIALDVSSFRVFRTYLRDAFVDYRGPYPCIDVFLTWGTKRFAAVPVKHESRQNGTSNYTFSKLFIHTIGLATGFSTLPLRIASFLGFGFTIFGCLVLVYVIGRYLLYGTAVQGFPFLASVIAIFSGVQLFSLGIFGEYLARMHYRLMERPTYAVKEKC